MELKFDEFSNLDAEKSLLGACIMDSDALVSAMEILGPESFYTAKHQELFRAMVSIDSEGKPVDMVSLADYLMNSKSSHADMVDISEIAGYFYTSAHAKHYAEIIADNHIRRESLKTLVQAVRDLQDPGSKIDSVVSSLDSKLTSLATVRSKDSIHSIGDIVTNRFEQYEKMKEGQAPGVASGFSDLDILTGGFGRKEMTVLAARPSVGKSAIGLNVAVNAAAEGYNVMFFSLEMSEDSLADRVLAAETSVDHGDLRTGMLQATDWERLSGGIGKIHGLPLWVCEDPSITSHQIRAYCRRQAKSTGMDLVIVDYLGIVAANDPWGETKSEVTHIGNVTKRLRGMLKDLDASLLLIHQLNRTNVHESRPPRLHDLRGSGEIEQDADVVAFLHAPDDSETSVDLMIAKNRHGPTGKIDLYFKKEFSKFHPRSWKH